MGFHNHAGGHGRVFRGLKKDGRKMVPINKRADDDLLVQRPGRDKPIMRIPEGFPPELAEKAKDSNYDVETVYENVVVTMPQTFQGEPQFFTTLPPASTSAAQSAAQTTSAAAENSRNSNKNDDDDDQDDDEENTPSRRPAAQSTATSSSTSAESTTSRAVTSEKDNASSTSSAAAAEVTSSSIVTGDASSVRNAMLADSTSSMTGGTALEATHSASPSSEPEKTGMNGGAKAGLAMGIIFGLALVFGLLFFCWRRKKSQQGLEAHNEKSATPPPPQVNRFSSDSIADRSTTSQTPATAPRLSLRPVTQLFPNLTGDNRKSLGNMFGGAANSTEKSGNQTPEQNPFGDAAVLSEKQANSTAGSDKSHDRANSVNSDNSVPSTPGSASFATAAAVPGPRGPNNVHRVQLDFKPSMEDELELKSGQLVRMLHEYDDGWALCTKMDRSSKGVVPRTCLSKMPVKPRGPPPQNRPPPGGPNAAPAPPPGAEHGAVPRPLTPSQQGRQRAPTLDGVPARKPVPGQAL
ncbi:hypothetical protein Q7P37_006262 [Cladosporium fusiforme]